MMDGAPHKLAPCRLQAYSTVDRPNPARPLVARLILIGDATDEDGHPRVALALPTEANGHRPPLLVFKSLAAALAAKAEVERAELAARLAEDLGS